MDIETQVDEMSKDERSLLLYLECRAVDHGGLVEAQHMNADDFAIVTKWIGCRFIRFSRIPSHLWGLTKTTCRHVVELSEQAHACAAVERNRRARRSQRIEIVKPSLEHFESQNNRYSPDDMKA